MSFTGNNHQGLAFISIQVSEEWSENAHFTLKISFCPDLIWPFFASGTKECSSIPFFAHIRTQIAQVLIPRPVLEQQRAKLQEVKDVNMSIKTLNCSENEQSVKSVAGLNYFRKIRNNFSKKRRSPWDAGYRV